MNDLEKLKSGVAQMGLELSEEALSKLLRYRDLLDKWNKVYNLTAIRDKNEMVSYHLLDSLVVLPYLWEKKWLDVGSGGGVPGLVLAIARPDWNFTLLDSNTKKSSFMQQAVIELGLSNVSVHCGRVEDWGVQDGFDGIISRAFSELGEFFKLTRHLLGPQGHWAAMKSQLEEGLLSIPQDCEIERVIELNVPGLVGKRRLVIAKVS